MLNATNITIGDQQNIESSINAMVETIFKVVKKEIGNIIIIQNTLVCTVGSWPVWH